MSGYPTLKYIHAADIHLDSPLRGLERYEGAPVDEIRLAARRALTKLVDLAIEESVSFVLIAGDLYDGDWREYNTGIFFIEQAKRLRDAQIPLLMIAGNHDAANKMTKSLRLPENTFFFSAESPETKILDDLGVAVHGQSFATAAVYDDLSAKYPKPISGLFNIGMLHTCAAGREGHERYAPCSIEALKTSGYDYWALGHVHQRETFNESPYVAFSGNIQGRHAKETGPKGCLLVETAASRIVGVEFRELGVMRWKSTRLGLDNCNGFDDSLELIGRQFNQLVQSAPDQNLAVRLELTGESKAHSAIVAHKQRFMQEIRLLAGDVSCGSMWIEKIVLSSRSPRFSKSDELLDGAIAELRTLFAELRSAPIEQSSLDLDDVVKKLPAELQDAMQGLAAEQFENIANEAEALLFGRLLSFEGDR